jgi:hypothetical protein
MFVHHYVHCCCRESILFRTVLHHHLTLPPTSKPDWSWQKPSESGKAVQQKSVWKRSKPKKSTPVRFPTRQRLEHQCACAQWRGVPKLTNCQHTVLGGLVNGRAEGSLSQPTSQPSRAFNTKNRNLCLLITQQRIRTRSVPCCYRSRSRRSNQLVVVRHIPVDVCLQKQTTA